MIRYCLLYFFTFFNALIVSGQTRKNIGIEKWTVITIDSTRQSWGIKPFEWLRGFGIDAEDVGTGYKNIVAGWYFYKNPGGDMQGGWKRYGLKPKADGLMFVNVDGDECADFIATTLPHVYWFEFTGNKTQPFNVKQIGSIPATDHINGQGYKIADIIKGGKPEILIKGKDGVYMAEVPQAPFTKNNWGFINIAPTASSEGFDVADIDGDGDADIISGEAADPKNIDDARLLCWYENPGFKKKGWVKNIIGKTTLPIDRIRAADLNNDGIVEIVVTEEKVDDVKPIANLWKFTAVSKSKVKSKWSREHIATHYSLNNLDLADIDNDGYIDIATAEHKGPDLKVLVYLNNSKGSFAEHIICKGVEMHLGCKLVDMDGDGDLDIIGAAWDHTGLLTVIRNDN